jgi:transcription-repair coupling factor (superfamily II helicase)
MPCGVRLESIDSQHQTFAKSSELPIRIGQFADKIENVKVFEAQRTGGIL